MSKTIDERVVEMRFDNRQFESNVQTSMSTLDKLKQKLNFKGASKGLEEINTASKNVNMSALGSAVETVKAKFSALEVMGVTALANITNQAVNAGKRMISALTIDPVKTGFSEYETKINAVQVIQANTRGKNTMEDITAALEELNLYADKTIYNFAQMTSNIGKFTAQGLDVQQASKAVQGLANLAAASGASAEDMARATYQMSQALGGTIRLMDWNSLRNANMATTTLKETLMDLARVNGIAIDDMIAKHGTFEQTLSEGWLSGQMFSEAMNIYSGVYSEAELKAKGFNDAQVKNFIELAKMAESAATEVKTFTQLWDVLKETAQSGWTQTWELIVGDFESAKSMLTKVQVYFSSIIDGWSKARNELLESAFVKGFKDLAERIKELVRPASEAVETIQETVEAVTDLGKVVDEVIFGKFGNGQERFDALTKAGINYYEVQNKVNETLGDSFRYTQEQIDAQKKVLGTQTKVTDATEATAEATKELTDADAELLEMRSKLSDEDLKELGYTEKQIEAFRELTKVSEQLGIPIKDLVKNIDEIDGRWLFIESFKNIGQGLIKTFKAIGKAFRDIFPPMTADQLFNIIAGFHKLSTKLKPTGQTLDRIRRIFRGLFAAMDVVAKITGGALKIAFEVVKGLLDYFKVDILDLAANVGDAIVRFNDWIDSLVNVQAVVEVIGPIIQTVVQALADLVSLIGQSEGFNSFIGLLKSIGSTFGEWFKGLKETDDIPKYIFEGLVNGLIEWTPKVVKALFDLGVAIIDAICEVLGIHSPSTVFIAIGGFIMAGLAIGIRDGWGEVWAVITDIFSNIVTFIKELDLGTIIAGSVALGITGSVWKISSALEAFASPFDGLGDMLEELGDGMKSALKGLGKMFKGIGSNFKASAWKKRATAIAIFAGAIAVLAAAVWALAQLDQGAMWGAVLVITALAGIIGGLAFAMSKLSDMPNLQLGKVSLALVAMGVTILLMASAIKMLSTLDGEAIGIGITVVGGLALFVGLLMVVSSKWGYGAKNLGSTLVGISVAMLLMVGIIKIISMMNPSDIALGLGVMVILGGIIVGLIAATKLAGKDRGKIATTLLGLSIAMLLLVGVMKIIGTMDPREIVQGLLVMVLLTALISGMVNIVGNAGKDIGKIGTTILAVSAAMLLMSATMKIIGGMNPTELFKGLIGITVLSLIIMALIAVVGKAGKGELAKIGTTIIAISLAMLALAGVAKIIGTMSWEEMGKAAVGIGFLVAIIAALILVASNREIAKIGVTMLLLSVSIAILAGVAMLLGLLEIDHLAKGVVAVSILSAMMALLIAVSKNAKDCKTEILILAGAVAILAGVVVLLSFIEPDRLLPASVALGIVMGMFALMSATAKKVEKLLPTMAVMILVVAALATVLWGLSALEVDSVIENAIGLGILMSAMAVVCQYMKGVDVAAAAKGALALSAFVGLLGVFVAILGAISLIEGVDDLLKGGGDILGLIGEAIGKFIGGIGKGISVKMAEGLPEIADYLSQFMDGLQPFLAGLENIDDQAMTGVKNLVETLLLLTGADLLNTMTSWITGGDSVEEFSSSLASLGKGLAGFTMNLGSEFNSYKVKSGADAILALAKAANEIPNSGGWLANIVGDNNITEFCSRLPEVGRNLSAFANNLDSNGTFDETKVKAVQTGADAITTLANAAKEIPESGGWLAAIVGDNDILTFAEKLPTLGTKLAAFAWNIRSNGEWDDSKVRAIECGCNAMITLAKASKELPTEGGWLNSIVGHTDVLTFAEKLPTLGGKLSLFAVELNRYGGFDDKKVTAVNCAAEAIKNIAQASEHIPNDGWFGKIFGSGDITTFGAKMPELGGYIAEMASKLSNTFAVDVKKAVDCINALTGLSSNDFNGKATGITEFGKAMVGVAESVATFCSSIGEISSAKISVSIAKLEDLIDFATNFSSVNADGIKSFTEAFGKVGSDGVKKFTDSFTEDISKTRVQTAASNLLSDFITGMNNNITRVEDAAEDVGENAADEIGGKTVYDDFKSAGKHVVDGFATGISERTWYAEAKAAAMAEAAKEAAEEALGIESPSKEFYAVGRFAGMGFVNALDDYGHKAYVASSGMASSARNGLSDAIGTIRSLIEGDWDVQPTIRPVLDLSDVRAGAGSIGNMLNIGSSIGVLSNVGAISSAMNRNSQNGKNGEVVGAINRLRKDLGNVGNNTYNINGVTYDDGSNVSDAVKVIVRAARVERRR